MEETGMGSIRFTNFLLLVIAVCLMYMCVRNEATPASAANTGPVLVRIDWSDLQSKSRYSPLGVELRDQVKVDMSSVASQSRYNPITVRVKD
jgi:hypothetical protein